MLKIRSTQMNVFEQAATRGFEDRMVEHLTGSFPKNCTYLGEERVRRIVLHGWERAKAHGLTYERSVRLYLTLMFMLGSGFDTDPQFPWAGEILGDASLPNEVARIDGLFEKATGYLAAAAGPRNEHLDAALGRIAKEPAEGLPRLGSPEFYREALARLGRIFPQKCEQVGEFPLRRMIQRGIDAAGRYGLASEGGAALFVGLMFMLGSGFDTDPQFPWAEATLKDETITRPERKVEQLHAEAASYLQRWLH